MSAVSCFANYGVRGFGWSLCMFGVWVRSPGDWAGGVATLTIAVVTLEQQWQ